MDETSTYGSTTPCEEVPGTGPNGYQIELPREHKSVVFVNVSYAVSTGMMRLLMKPNKTILNSVSGLMLPGMNAILGPTGSGKTTLLDILADRKARKGLTGSVLINGRARTNNFRWLAGYVVQVDTLTGTLSVRENLSFSATLRLPSHLTRQQRKERVEKVINELGLQGCADQMVGTTFIRGVSGGERKRTSIGMELITEPQVLFLDEPTTGLDAYTAESIVKILNNLTQDGERIVVMSIHQPRHSIFKYFNTLTLLSQGNVVYYGPATQCIDYFKAAGFPHEGIENPADFLLDTIMHCENAETKDTQEVLDADIAAIPLLSRTTPSLLTSYHQSKEYRKLMNTVQSMVENAHGGTDSSQMPALTYPSNFFVQVGALCSRSLSKAVRDPSVYAVQLVMMVVLSLLLGGTYFQLPKDPKGLEDRIGAFAILTVAVVYGNLNSVEVFIAERAVFLHENASGYYRVSAFFLTKALIDLVFLRLIPTIMFSIITYFMMGLQAQFDKVIIYTLTLSLTGIAATSTSLAFSALINTYALANMAVSTTYVFQLLYGGFFLGLSSIPDWIGWIQYLSLFRYSSEALTVNELQNQVYNGSSTDSVLCPYKVVDSYCIVYGDEVLEYSGYKLDWIWFDELALLMITILWLILAYISLRLAKVYHRYYQ